MWKVNAGAVVALGGDGTCRDVAIGWPDAPLIAMSTGTNNAFPTTVDATSAGVAAGLVASGAVDTTSLVRRSKRVSLTVVDERGTHDDLALVDVALIDTTFVGSRAVLDPHAVRVVVASMAAPSGTGLSAIAGRLHPIGRFDDGGVLVRLGPGGRQVRVPMAPGAFTTICVAEVTPLQFGEAVELHGPGVLAVDGERDRLIGRDAHVTAAVELTGPAAHRCRRHPCRRGRRTALRRARHFTRRTTMATEFLMPKLGLTMEEGTIREWLVPDGGEVQPGMAVMCIETDKVESEVESSVGGRLHHIAGVGDTFPCGAVIGLLLAEGEAMPSPGRTAAAGVGRADRAPRRAVSPSP